MATGNEEHKSPPHPDLVSAFEALTMHAALLAELVAVKDYKDYPNLFTDEATKKVCEKFNVTGFTIVGDNEGVILTAQKTLKTGNKLSFNTPTLRWNDEGQEPYPHAEECLKAVDKCREELAQYLDGKFAADPQLSLEMDTQA